MTAAVTTPDFAREVDRPHTVAGRAKQRLSSPWASLIAVIIAVLWTLPTAGLLITSLRPEEDINSTGWWKVFTDPSFTLNNYREALTGGTSSLQNYFVNSIVITIPSVIIPVVLASIAAYAFAWIRFPLRDTLFVALFALQIVPIQVTLIPLLKLYVDPPVGQSVAGSFIPVWISHSIFAMPLAVYLLHNFMRDVPNELIEAAKVDGAGHVKIFTRIMLPLLVPAIAAFAIFQFLWVWNDLLVALVFAGGNQNLAPLTVRIAELSGTRGTDWYLLSAGAFITVALPLLVFLFGQRFFVRGLLAGSVKG